MCFGCDFGGVVNCYICLVDSSFIELLGIICFNLEFDLGMKED